jgi:hypothetical protein
VKEANAMSMANVTTGPEYWEPALTPRDAHVIGISRRQYDAAAEFARVAVIEHQRLGTARDRWEPTTIVNEKLAAPYIADGEQELSARLQGEANPRLDEAQSLVENVKENLDEITADREPISTPESGVNYPVARAVQLVGEHDETIRRDEADGRHHHNRASVLLKRLATYAPWLEAVGFLTFVTYYLNVPLLQPWQDWLGWSFAVVVVAVIILGQTWLVRHAAQSHNQAREVYLNHLHHERQRACRRRNWYLAGTAVTAAAITGGMIWRGTAALANASLGTTLLMIFLAAITGLLLPTLAYLGVALDGSKVSRERDHLAAELDDDFDAYADIVSDSRRDLARVAEIGDTLKDKTFPDICHTTQETVNEIYELHSTVRLLIGGLSADPPAKTTKTVAQDAAGMTRGFIGTSITGAGDVNLDPLFDREHRLEDIETQRAGLSNRLEALPPHPWGGSRT